MQPVHLNSSMFRSAQYDETTHMLTVTFHKGQTASVPCSMATYLQFVNSESPGQFWHRHLKPN